MSSRYQQITGKIVLHGESLARRSLTRAASDERRQRGREGAAAPASRNLVIGILIVMLALMELVSGLFLLRRRRRRLVLGLVGVCAISLVCIMLFESVLTVGVISVGFLVLGFIGTILTLDGPARGRMT